ncbi:MAG TPA: hypothetical protein VGX28_06260 [Frankiaceae bacterium]|nr:hypothetical protein [Frankiaceae bacterium]
MRWPWRRRPKGGRVVFIGTSPFDVAQAIAAVPTPSPVVEAWVPDPEPDVPGIADVSGDEPEALRVGVQLGFADGTVMTLDDDDPRAVALRAAAARLTGTG